MSPAGHGSVNSAIAPFSCPSTFPCTTLRAMAIALTERISVLIARAEANEKAGNPRRAARAKTQIEEVQAVLRLVRMEQTSRDEAAWKLEQAAG